MLQRSHVSGATKERNTRSAIYNKRNGKMDQEGEGTVAAENTQEETVQDENKESVLSEPQYFQGTNQRKEGGHIDQENDEAEVNITENKVLRDETISRGSSFIKIFPRAGISLTNVQEYQKEGLGAELPEANVEALKFQSRAIALGVAVDGYSKNSAEAAPPTEQCATNPHGASINDAENSVKNNQNRMPFLNLNAGNMTAQDMLDCLRNHGCSDLTLRVDLNHMSAISFVGGGFGDIFKGKLHDGTKIAVKMLRVHIITEDVSSKWLKRIMREIYIWSKADHENVQELMGIAIIHGRLSMISLWMKNGNLQQYIKGFPGVNRYELCTQVAAGVAYLHGINMVHGDLKALNILVSTDGIAKISDFDLSILSDCSLVFSATTNRTGGTFRWMAPELVLEEDDDDNTPTIRNKHTDVYALGMTLLEITTGNVPYAEYRSDGTILKALMKAKFPKRPEPLSSLNKRGNTLWSLMETCWDHDPSARPEASKVHELLTQISKLEDT